MAERSNTQLQMIKIHYRKQLFFSLLRKTILKEVKFYTIPPSNSNHSKNSPPTHEHCLIFNLWISLEKSGSTADTTLKESSKASLKENKKASLKLDIFSKGTLMKCKVKLNDLMSTQRRGSQKIYLFCSLFQFSKKIYKEKLSLLCNFQTQRKDFMILYVLWLSGLLTEFDQNFLLLKVSGHFFCLSFLFF